jgi:hypothetical protein
MVINSTGNVGINVSNPSCALNSNTKALQIYQNTVNGSGVRLTSSTTDFEMIAGDNATYIYNTSNDDMRFGTNNTERMRINTSGHLLVGCTAYTGNTTNTGGGIYVDGSGSILFSSATDATGVFNRVSTDGNIVEYRRDGGTVGSISSSSGNTSYNSNGGIIYIGGNQSNHLKVLTSSATGAPRIEPSADNAVNLGQSGLRFKDLYLSGGAYLGGTGSANHLDDYEEGTFSGTTTGSVYSGTYTKIGRICHVSFESDNASSTGTSIAVMPFSAKGGGTAINGAQPTYNTSNTNDNVYVAIFNGGVSAYIYTRTGTTQSVTSGLVVVNFVYETD